MVAFVFKWAWLKKKDESEAAPSFKIKLIASAEQVFGIRQGVLQEFIIFFFERVKRKKNNTEPLANKQPGQEKGGLFSASLNGSDGIIKVDEYIFHGYHMKEPSLPE